MLHESFKLGISWKLVGKVYFRQTCSLLNFSGVIANSAVTNERVIVMYSGQEHHIWCLPKITSSSHHSPPLVHVTT